MKPQKIVLAMIIATLLFTFNCKKDNKDDSSKNFLLGYLLDQASGNCAQITKNTTGTIYSAVGTTIPKGGCNATTLQTGLYTTSVSEAVTANGTYNDALKAVFDLDSECSSFSTAQTVAKAAISSSTYSTTLNGLTSGSSGCASANLRASSGKVSSVFICKDDASIAAVKALANYYSVTSVATDMANSLADLKVLATAVKSTTGFSDTQIAAMKGYGATEAAALSSVTYYAYFTSAATSACSKAVVARDASLKSTLTSFFGNAAASTAGISASETAAVTEVTTASLKCGYGSSFTAVTTAGSVNPTCPSTYPTY